MTARAGYLLSFVLTLVCFVVSYRCEATALVDSDGDTLKRFDAMSSALQACITNLASNIEPPIDTIPATTDSVKPHSPKRAALYSAVLPGLGQVYNRQYWKVPLIYAGGAVAGYLIYFNYTYYYNLHQAFRHRKAGDTGSYEDFVVKGIFSNDTIHLTQFTDSELLQYQQIYRRDLDLSVLLAIGIYTLNIVDAVVFAHLYDFDVSEDLSLRMKPTFNYTANGMMKQTMQVGLTYRF